MAAVIIIEDDDAIRSTFRSVLEESDGFEVGGEAATRDAGKKLIHEGGFDVMLVDLDLRGQSGIELISLCRARLDAKIIVISVLGDETTVIKAIEAGADGYVLKDSAYRDLVSLVQRVLNGEAPISPAVARHLLRRLRAEDSRSESSARNFALSPREFQVLQELARGASNKEVAIKFDISVHTVGDYVKSLYRKLEVSSRGQAINRAAREGLIDL